VGEQSLVQKDVYSHALFPTYFLQISEDVNVCENIHYYGNHLRDEAEEQAVSSQERHLTLTEL
jgi:hypothetical protein